MSDRLKSLILVGLQFLFIFLLLTTTPWRHLPVASYVLIGLSVALILWAGWTMKKSKLRIFPQPAQSATLVVNGPYRFIRHPMYTSVLLCTAGLLAAGFSWLRLVYAMLLLGVLVLKLLWEEEMLSRKFEGYKAYQKQTKRLLPFLY